MKINSLTKIYWDAKSPIFEISISTLSNKGIKCLLLDVDGTLLSRNTEILPLNVKKWILNSKKFFDLYLISNNVSEKRISKIGHELGINYKYKALKPQKKHTLEVINKINIDKKNIAIIGDRIFTDIIVGNRCNIKTILVQSLNKKGAPKNFNVILMLEKFFSKFIP
tara:strand:- start:462 stop:962 length:501 start_codon:yes stop_codon:yes gene_type:complete